MFTTGICLPRGSGWMGIFKVFEYCGIAALERRMKWRWSSGILCQGASGGTCCLKTEHNVGCFGERCHCVCDMFPSSLQGRNYKNTQAVSASLRAVSTGSDGSAWWLSCKYIKMQGFQALLVRYYCTCFKQKHFPFSPPWTGEAFRWEVSLEWCW